MRKGDVEKSLKRYLKRKISFTTAILVSFFITGDIYAQTQNLEQERLDEVTAEKILEENFYKKSNEKNTQVFFILDHHHTSGSKNGSKSNFSKKIEQDEDVIEDVKNHDINLDFLKPNFNIDNLVIGGVNLLPGKNQDDILKNDINNILDIEDEVVIENKNFENILENDLVLRNVVQPEIFEANQINIPKAPEITTITIPKISIPDMATYSSVNADEAWFWEPKSLGYYEKGHNGTISEVIMKSGKWNINVGGNTALNGWSGSITDYTASLASPYGDASITDAHYKTDGVIGEGNAGIYRIIGSPYSSFEKETTVNIDATDRVKNSQEEYVLRQFIHYDPHGDKAQPLNEIVELTSDERSEAQYMFDNYKAVSETTSPRSMVVSLKGDINLVGNSMNIVGLQGHAGANPYLLNSGNISVSGDSNVILAYTEAAYGGEKYDYFTSNYGDGKIIIKDGTQNFVMIFNKDYVVDERNGTISSDVHNFKNSGIIDVAGGSKNIGIYVKKEANNGTIDLQTPITISGGSQNIGFVHKYEEKHVDRNILNEKSTLNFNIAGGTNNVAVIEENNQKFASHKINIENSSNSIGIISKSNTVDLGTGSLNINESNSSTIGFLTDGGNIISSGDININGSEENKIAIATNGNSIVLNGKITTDTNNSKLFYTEDENSTITVKGENLKAILTGDSIGAFANNGVINLSSASIIDATGLDKITPNVLIDNSKSDISQGIGLYAQNGGVVQGDNTYLKVINGQAGVASIGENSLVSMSGGVIDYSGSGYAIYTENGGKVNLTNGTVILSGKGVGIEADLGKELSSVNLTGGKIIVASNDAVAVKLKNVNSDLNISNLQAGVEGVLNLATIEGGIGADGKVYDSFKIAAIDGGTLNIDTDISKDSIASDTPGDFYYKRFLGQRLKLNVLEGKNITAEVTSEEAEKYYNGQVAGLENTSSKLAKSNEETQINLKENSTISADRIDSGNGAIGVYINYGQISLEKGSKILIENGDNEVNSGGVGIYSVNGSEVNSSGALEIYGDNATGIYALTDRVTPSGQLLENEFGNQALGQGTAKVENNGTINLYGKNNVGIFIENNNSKNNSTASVATNNGTINLNNSQNNGVGIYGIKSTIINKGSILTGNGGVGIFGKNESIINEIGNIEVGNGGTAIALDETSNLNSNITELSFTGIGTESKENRFGLFLQGEFENSVREINLNLNGENFENGALLVANDTDIKSAGTLNIGNNGIGIVGNKNIENLQSGIINLSSNYEIGIMGLGENNEVINNGIINLTGTNGVGIYLSEGAKTSVNSNINVQGKNNIGYLAEENAILTIDKDINFKNDNSLKNILAYGRDGANISLNSQVTIDGINTTSNGNTIGIYLTGKTLSNNLVMSENSKLNVLNGAIGIYNNGSNNINLTEVASSGDGSIGLYTAGNLELNGDFSINDGSYGVYSDGGAIDLKNLSLDITSNGKSSVGLVLDDGATVLNGTVNFKNNSDELNIALAYMNTGDKVAENNIDINLLTKYSIGVGATQNANIINTGTINTGKNIGLYVAPYGTNSITNKGEILVTSGIGAYVSGANSKFDNTDGKIKVSSTAGVGTGIFLKNTTENSVKIGNLKVGDNGVKIYADNSVVDFDIDSGDSKVINLIAQNGTKIKNNISVANGSIGVYLNDETNSFENTTISVDKSDNNLTTVGVYLKDNLDYSLDNLNINSADGVGIYSNNNLLSLGKNVDISAIENGIGIFLQGSGIENNGILTSSNGAVGALLNNVQNKNISLGQVNVAKLSSGAIISNSEISSFIGKFDILDGGLGIYASDSNVVLGEQTDISVSGMGTIGVGIEGNSNVVSNGMITVSGESVGMIAKGPGAVAINKGTIKVDENGVGISARDGALAINEGNIEVKDGIGMFSDKTSIIENKGKITIENGYGLVGDGKITNSGKIEIIGKGKKIYLTDQYTSIGGTLITDGEVVLNGATIDITKDKPAFDGDNISGNIKLLSNFVTLGNGLEYKVDNFMENVLGVEAGSNINIKTSPLFKNEIDSTGNLLLTKVPYKDIISDSQYDSLGNGLDNILGENGSQSDIKALKELNAYLNNLSDSEFKTESERTIGEIRGDIYSNIQDRIADIDNAFDQSFDEMNTSYNKTKNTDKFSVIYSGGHFKDETVDANYDYDVRGLLYMKDLEGKFYGEKHGYSLGFAVSDFNFENTSSDEKVYSLRGGVHNVKPFDNNQVSLLTTLDVTYNRHRTERDILLNERYENKADINSYTVEFGNKLSKIIYRDLDSEFCGYTAMDFEYGRVIGFNEDGTLELRVHENDYLSSKARAGFRGYHRHYLDEGIALKPMGKIEYSYELGNVYSVNKAKLKDGNEDYYSLSCPAKERGVLKTTFGLALEKVDHMGVTIQVDIENNEGRNETEVNYSLRFNYKF